MVRFLAVFLVMAVISVNAQWDFILSMLRTSPCEYLLPQSSTLVTLINESHFQNVLNAILECDCYGSIPYAVCKIMSCMGFNINNVYPDFRTCDTLLFFRNQLPAVNKLVLDILQIIQSCRCPRKIAYGFCASMSIFGYTGIDWENKLDYFTVPPNLKCNLRA